MCNHVKNYTINANETQAKRPSRKGFLRGPLLLVYFCGFQGPLPTLTAVKAKVSEQPAGNCR